MEDYSNDPKVILKIWEFLGMQTPTRLISKQLEKYATYNSAKINMGQMLPRTQKILADFFRKANKVLATLIDDESFEWQ